MATKTKPRQPGADRILDVVLSLCAERPWREITMEEIADAAGATLSRVYKFYPTRPAIVAGLLARVDKAVLSDHDSEDTDEPYRDRLLDVLMRRFEAQSLHKPAIRSILRDLTFDPILAVCSMPAFANSMAWSLEASGIRANGPLGLIRIKGLGLIYLSAIRVWLNDETPDLSVTMSRLDRDLRLAETLITALPCRERNVSEGN
ncbi:MAG: TetR/AcrR family transcriptional regulator [Pseudomonadota bacterium]|nr:TetR/AcrR family transcriptional regulator [Pseudomonadota bacterium]